MLLKCQPLLPKRTLRLSQLLKMPLSQVLKMPLRLSLPKLALKKPLRLLGFALLI